VKRAKRAQRDRPRCCRLASSRAWPAGGRAPWAPPSPACAARFPAWANRMLMPPTRTSSAPARFARRSTRRRSCSVTLPPRRSPDRARRSASAASSAMAGGRGVLWPRCFVAEVFCGQGVLWPRCVVTEVWPRCVVTEVCPRCVVTEVWPRCVVTEVWPRCFVTEAWPRCGRGVS